MPNTLFTFGLFLSSYSPAFLILAVRSWHRSGALAVGSLCLCVLSVACFVLFIWVGRKGGPFRAVVEEIEPRDSELAAYVATYLLPFVVVFGATVQDVIALGLFLLFIGVLWVNSGMVYLNPLLAMAGYHLYVVRVRPIGAPDSLPRSFLLTRRRNLRSGDEVKPDTITRGVLIDMEQGRHGD